MYACMCVRIYVCMYINTYITHNQEFGYNLGRSINTAPEWNQKAHTGISKAGPVPLRAATDPGKSGREVGRPSTVEN